MREIELTRGKVAMVDDDMFDYLLQWKWRAMPGKWGVWYALRSSKQADVDSGLVPLRRQAIFMHSVIINAQRCERVDHRDNDGLNNQKFNLRLSTPSQNRANARKLCDGKTSYYKGVSKDKGKWRARIRFNDRLISLGYFFTQEEAAIAYDGAAIRLFGEFAHPNLPAGRFFR